MRRWRRRRWTRSLNEPGQGPVRGSWQGYCRRAHWIGSQVEDRRRVRHSHLSGPTGNDQGRRWFGHWAGYGHRQGHSHRHSPQCHRSPSQAKASTPSLASVTACCKICHACHCAACTFCSSTRHTRCKRTGSQVICRVQIDPASHMPRGVHPACLAPLRKVLVKISRSDM